MSALRIDIRAIAFFSYLPNVLCTLGSRAREEEIWRDEINSSHYYVMIFVLQHDLVTYLAVIHTFHTPLLPVERTAVYMPSFLSIPARV